MPSASNQLEVERSPRGGRSARPTPPLRGAPWPAVSVGFSKRKTSPSTRFSHARQAVALLTFKKKPGFCPVFIFLEVERSPRGGRSARPTPPLRGAPWPAISVGFSTTPSDDASLGTPVAKNIALDSILSRKASSCLAHLQ